MKRFIDTYDGRPFDVIVVGGGISGAAVAYDAASRGLSVALLEKQDFGCATSAATSKLIHGGFRYLANLELGMVRESLAERRTLLHIAPNLVYPQPVILTLYGGALADNKLAIRTGMLLYHLLSLDRRSTRDRSKKIPRPTMLSASEVLRREPNVRAEGLQGGGLIYDCRSLCPERLTLAFVKSAVREGAQVANYARVESFIASGRLIRGVRVRDVLTRKQLDIEGRLVVNCGGPWADIIRNLVDDAGAGVKVRRSEGIHLITGKLVSDNMVSCNTKSGGRVFLLPWRDHTLIGITDKEYVGDPDEYRVTRVAIEELLADVNAGFGASPLRYEDVLYAYGGLRPLVEDQTKGTYESSRKYEIYDNAREGVEGLITVAGGKYTTSRSLAEHAMDMVAAKLGRPPGKCTTAKRCLAGCEITDMNAFVSGIKAENSDFEERTLDWLARHYGTDVPQVIALARADRSLAAPLDADGEVPAQVLYAIREELALTLADIFLRRTGLGTLGDPGHELITKVANLTAAELGWDAERTAREVSHLQRSLRIPA